MNCLNVPDYASASTKKLADKLNARIQQANAELTAAQRAHNEAVRAQAQAPDIMSCDPDEIYQASGVVQQAARNLRAPRSSTCGPKFKFGPTCRPMNVPSWRNMPPPTSPPRRPWRTQ